MTDKKEYIFVYKKPETREEIFRWRGTSILKADKLFEDRFGYSPSNAKDKVITDVLDVKVR